MNGINHTVRDQLPPSVEESLELPFPGSDISLSMRTTTVKVNEGNAGLKLESEEHYNRMLAQNEEVFNITLKRWAQVKQDIGEFSNVVSKIYD